MAREKKKTSGIFTGDNINFKITNAVAGHNDRKHIINKYTAEELNTYSFFGHFPTFADNYPDEFEKEELTTAADIQRKDGSKGKPIKIKSKKNYNINGVRVHQGLGTPGVKSLFNKAGAIIIGTDGNLSNNEIYKVSLDAFAESKYENAMSKWRLSRNAPLLDSRLSRIQMRKELSCTISDLIYASEHGDLGLETYSYSDFMYCKHLGKMSNNYLITLRKFPYPIGDYIGGDSYFHSKVPDNQNKIGDQNITMSQRDTIRKSLSSACIGCMVTWMGVSGNHLNEILRYSYKQPFKEQQAELQDTKSDADSNTSLLNGIFSAFDKSYQKAYAEGTHGTAVNAAFRHFGINLGDPPYSDHKTFKDRNKVYGPIDAIKSTYIRSDEGMIFNHKFTLTFEYELRAYNGINPRQAMLDLLSNILAVTYTTGSFWGGGIKGYGAQQSNIFANLNIFKKGNRTFTDFADSFSKDLTNIGDKIKSNFGISQGNVSASNIFAALKGILNTLGGMLVGGMLNRLGRPQKAMYNSLLSPAPIGFWHVTIGNPKAPIMSIGNLVLTNVQVEHNGPLGLDNFPTGLKVTVDLDRGKPRDSRDIEKLYMHGNDRIYSSMTDKVYDMYKFAKKYKDLSNKPVEFANERFVGKKMSDGKSEHSIWAENAKTVSVTQQRKERVGNQEKTLTSTHNYTTYSVAFDTRDDSLAYDAVGLTNNGASDAKLLSSIGKYYGQGENPDIMSIYISATEQEYGSSKPRVIKTSKIQEVENGNVVDREAENNTNNEDATY